MLDASEMPFADNLLASLGRGATTCHELQEAAQAMVLESEGHCSKVTRAIAKIGCYGKFPGNCERDLWRTLSLPIESSLRTKIVLCLPLKFFHVVDLFNQWAPFK